MFNYIAGFDSYKHVVSHIFCIVSHPRLHNLISSKCLWRSAPKNSSFLDSGGWATVVAHNVVLKMEVFNIPPRRWQALYGLVTHPRVVAGDVPSFVLIQTLLISPSYPLVI